MSQERLQKIIARAGMASRREAEEMIRAGRVTVNGRVVTQLGTRADPDADHVKVDGKLITRRETHRYILLNKPKEVMTTVVDPQGRRTVVDLVRGVKERIFPVGRLDYHSEGLILLTNDGELAYRVAHPSSGSVKSYQVKVRGVPEERLLDKLRRGITIDGRRTMPCEIERLRTTGRSDDEGNSWFDVKLREGRTNQIRKMFKAVGHPVAKLKRVAIGPISDAKLVAGQWRELTPHEVRLLISGREAAPVRPRAKRSTSRSKLPAAKKKRVTKATTKKRVSKPAAKKGAVRGRKSGSRRASGRV
ncbi:MAG TPA: pseudouridine synthase [Thermoanaerobaculia bacterium]|nr:pseudouridine synthase [Thermoanaerobaculia bacterium]